SIVRPPRRGGNRPFLDAPSIANGNVRGGDARSGNGKKPLRKNDPRACRAFARCAERSIRCLACTGRTGLFSYRKAPRISQGPEADETLVYDNPLVTRYASRPMAELWGPQRKFSTWRRLWVALAEAQHELGLRADDGVTPRITPAQLAELRAHTDDIDFERAAQHERRLRHDVMAHIHTYGEACPGARDIIHLGATSCYVTDNADLLFIREGLQLLRDQLVGA